MVYDINTVNIYQPHGSMAEYLNFKNKLILGHHKQEYLENPELLSGKYFDHYYGFALYTEKPVQQIIESQEMEEFLSKIAFHKIDEVIFFGFSYSIVDMDYIRKIKEYLSENTFFFMGYHSQMDFNNAKLYVEELAIKNFKIEKNYLIIKKIGSA